MQQLLSLKKAIYSLEFRQFISAVTGCDELTDRVDCSANAYTTGKKRISSINDFIQTL